MFTRRRFLGAVGAGGLTGVGGCLAEANIEYELGFEESAAELGLEYAAGRETLGPTPAGVYVNDFNNDGNDDLLLTGGSEIELFENDGGSFAPADALPEIALENVDFGLFFDHDNSGWDDLLLVPRSGVPVFLENREGRFRERTVGLEFELAVGAAATAADTTKNGYPDVFILQNGDWNAELPQEESDGVAVQNGGPNYLFHNDGGTFSLVEDAGLHHQRWSLATSFADFTGDGYPDIHVANDFGYDTFYRNRGDGTFDAFDIPDTNRHGMASSVADISGNGYLDVFVTNIRFENPGEFYLDTTSKTVNNEGNNLLFNQGDGEFIDRGEEYGVNHGKWGWAAVAVDFTNNSHYDLIHTTQMLEFYAQGAWREAAFYPRCWFGREEGFEELSGRDVGFDETDGRGLAWLDIDRDGFCDLVLGDLNGRFKVYRNVSSGGNWFQVKLRGRQDQTAIGSEVQLTAGGRTHYKQAHLQTDYLAQSSDVLHFGLGPADTVDTLEIRWPNGEETHRESLDANQRVEIAL